MANKLSTFIKKAILGKKQNLVSLDDQYEVMRKLLKGVPVTGIIDAGASYGRISKKLLGLFPNAHVYAFEPNPIYCETLQQVQKENVRLHPNFAALSDFVGTADFYITQAPSDSSLLAPEQRLKEISPTGASLKKTLRVDVTTIDQWAEQNGNPPIQLMKFDIQGAELKALQGGVRVLRSSTLLIYIEVWLYPVYQGCALFGDIDSFLRQNGFELLDLFKPHYDKLGRFAWANVIYINSGRLAAKLPL